MEEKEESLVKQVCKEYGITQKELAIKLDIPRGTLGRWASNDNIPRTAEIALNLMLENKELQNKLNSFKDFKNTLLNL